MDLQEVGRRIFGQYWWLIALLVVIGAGLSAVSHSGAKTYTASARIVLDTPDPTTRAGSTAIADTVKALATSPSQVSAALHDANIRGRDPLDIADNHVSVTGLGSSAVAKISVSDTNRFVAANLANALAARIIRTRRDVTSGGVPQEVAGLNKRIDDLTDQISQADAKVDALNVQVANAASAQQANDLRAVRDTVSRRRDFLSQQRGVLESERISILGNYALRPKPSIISRAAAPLHPDSSGVIASLVLGGLLGLILGVAIAGVGETVRPTLVGGDVIARELQLPMLGNLRGDVAEEEITTDLRPLAARVRLAADAAGVEDVGLLPARHDVDLSLLAERLDATVPSFSGAELTLAAQGDPASLARRDSFVGIRPFALASYEATSDATGIIVVAPRALKKADLTDLANLLMLTPVPLLGLITYSAASPTAIRAVKLRRMWAAKQPT